MLSKIHSKYIQSLHHKKFRDVENVFIAEGNKVVPELLSSSKFKCKEIVATTQWLQQNNLMLQKYFHEVIHEVQPHEMEKISALATHGEVLAVFEKTEPLPVNAKGKITLVLDTIQDPGNLGTIIRIADWFAVQHIICSTGSADIYNPKVVQSTMGSIARVNIVYTDILQWLTKNAAVKSYAAALDGMPVRQFGGTTEAIVIIGNESKGISPEIMHLANEKVTIPKIGEAESLNAAVAAGILLSHFSV